MKDLNGNILRNEGAISRNTHKMKKLDGEYRKTFLMDMKHESKGLWDYFEHNLKDQSGVRACNHDEQEYEHSARNEAAERERREKQDREEKERRDRERKEREDKERAEKERNDRERADRARQDKEKADRERQEKERVDRERAAREAKEREEAEKLKQQQAKPKPDDGEF